MTRSLVLAVLVAATLLPATAWPNGAILPEPGLYEAFSPVLGRPVGPVDKDTAAKLPRYIVDAITHVRRPASPQTAPAKENGIA